MINEYKYGAYGFLGDTVAQSVQPVGTAVVYIGLAPVNLVPGYKDLHVINELIKLSNFNEVYRTVGYSVNWAKYSLCEAFSAHFDNILGNIGPIYAINVLDPDLHRKATQTTVQVTFINDRAEFLSDTAILDTILIDNLVLGVDYSVSYNFGRGSVVIQSLKTDAPITGAQTVAFYEVDTTAITTTEIIAGINSVKYLNQNFNAVPNILAAPGWSEKPEVYKALVSESYDINGHWDAFVLADIPIAGATDTIEKAKTWKTAHGYSSERSKVCWPQAIDISGRVFHLSTLTAVEMLRIDYSHGSVPMETPGNKAIPIVRLYFGNGDSRGYDQQEANALTAYGITTAVSWAGKWVIWGDHTAAYNFGDDVDPRAVFDVSMRMLMYITNSFQREWGLIIGRPMDRQIRDRIINREQEKLDALVAIGALIGSPKIVFLESENPAENLMNGVFRWDIPVTPTPPLKAAIVYVAYTDNGFQIYYEGGAA